MTREQLATLLYRLEGEPEVTTTLDVVENVSSWAENAMIWAVSEGIILGDEKGNVNPSNTATRAEVATILMRYIDSIESLKIVVV